MNEIIILIVIFVTILIVFKIKDNFSFMKSKVYETAYDLGKNFINVFPYDQLDKPAVMFDIDDTILFVNEKNNTLKPIKSMIKLLNLCINKGLLIILITARDSVYTEQTIEQLNKYKINYSYLYLRNAQTDNFYTFKAELKKKLSLKYNIEIIMSIGDNLIDIDGDYSGYGIKLPNKEDPKLYHINNKGNLEEIV